MPAPNRRPARTPSWQITDPASVAGAAPTGHAPEAVKSSRWRRAAAKSGQAVRRHPFRAVVAATAVGALGMGGAATLAAWVDQVQVQVAVASGTLDVTIDGQQGNPTPVQVPLTGVLFKPGDAPVVTTVPLANAGSLPAVVTVKMTGLGASSLGSQLDATLTVIRPSSTPVTVTGKASSLTLATVTVPPNTSYSLELRLSLPSSTANVWQGVTDTLTISADAVQE
ncbi:MAG: hypothetical protein HGA44_05780 [Cellulomonadaceae bacterium]|nr:hypothetical protein [Cellulomonadaceae bacterium]